ncbi:MAG: penicillin-binding protein 2 [Pseudomonadota bacterium]|nr:penicillin-binding protein 2 [Pseudomonadota bacterium]
MKYEKIYHPFSPNIDEKDSGKTHFSGKSGNFGRQANVMEVGRTRLLVAGVLLSIIFLVIAGRVVELSLSDDSVVFRPRKIHVNSEPAGVRADIIDRNGVLLATTLPTTALYANPQHISNIEGAISKLIKVLPELDREKLREDLSSTRQFVYLNRYLTPKLKKAINDLGIPGLYFQNAERRVYAHGPLASHVIGMTGVDGLGLSGVEKYFEERLRSQKQALQLSLDIRIQAIVRTELIAAVQKFFAIGAAGIVLNVNTGEVIAMVSLPDFDPNNPVTASGIAGFNRATKGVYEMGSTFKLFTAAMALDTGSAKLTDRYDATKPIRISRFLISDYHAKNKWLTLPEIIVHSSNIGAAKLALDVGIRNQKKYLKRLGILSPSNIELVEIGDPLLPDRWRKINAITIAFGHGIAVSPLQLSTGVSSLVNGGKSVEATLLKNSDPKVLSGRPVVTSETSKTIRKLMRLVVRQGTGGKADVPGYRVGGKTGTAEKPGKLQKGYGKKRRISSFVGAFPMTTPNFLVFVIVDEPKGIEETSGFATGGWVAAPIVNRIISEMVSIIGIEPAAEIEKAAQPGDIFYVPQKKKVSVQDRLYYQKKRERQRQINEVLKLNHRPRGLPLEAN